MVCGPTEFKVRWLERPLVPDDIAAYAELKAMNMVSASPAGSTSSPFIVAGNSWMRKRLTSV
jgi:hypothetical protein